MKIKIFQLKGGCFDIKNNSIKIIKCINKSYEEGADVVCFPECALTGYPPEDRLFFEETSIQIKEK